jgi:hypothetical protein
VIVPIAGATGAALTVKTYFATATAHGGPAGLSEVIVMVTLFPASAAAGVYVNSNGDVAEEVVLTDPAPLWVIVTELALMKVFPLTVTGVVAQLLPPELLSTISGALTQPHETEKLLPVVVQLSAFFTVIV